MAVVGASMPTLRPLIVRFKPQPKPSGLKHSNSSAPSSKRSGEGVLTRLYKEDFQRIADNGTEAYAEHDTTNDMEMGEHGSKRENGIMVTNGFSTS